MGAWELIADRPLVIEGLELSSLELSVRPGFTRRTTVVRLRGAGEEGVGEDVVYAEDDQLAYAERGGDLPLAGEWTLASFSDHVGSLDLFPDPPTFEWQRPYRRWGLESAALDLALRQAGLTVEEALGRRTRPVRFVTSPRLGEPPSTDLVDELLERVPSVELKLDPTGDWTPELCADLARTGAVRVVDFKGCYEGTPVDQPADPDLYGMVVDAFPDAWLEDPDLTEETRRVLSGHEARVTWDAPFHAPSDIDDFPFAPRMLNVKPSRFGSLRALLATYERCAAEGIELYGGGQFELGPGRGQIQLLASLFHPDGPNDVAPRAYHRPGRDGELPPPPLEPPDPLPPGFRWT